MADQFILTMYNETVKISNFIGNRISNLNSRQIESKFKEFEGKIKEAYNSKVKKETNLILKFRDFLNSFEEEKINFFEKIDKGNLTSEEQNNSSDAFFRIAERFSKDFGFPVKDNH